MILFSGLCYIVHRAPSLSPFIRSLCSLLSSLFARPPYTTPQSKYQFSRFSSIAYDLSQIYPTSRSHSLSYRISCRSPLPLLSLRYGNSLIYRSSLSSCIYLLYSRCISSYQLLHRPTISERAPVHRVEIPFYMFPYIFSVL